MRKEKRTAFAASGRYHIGRDLEGGVLAGE